MHSRAFLAKLVRDLGLLLHGLFKRVYQVHFNLGEFLDILLVPGLHLVSFRCLVNTDLGNDGMVISDVLLGLISGLSSLLVVHGRQVCVVLLIGVLKLFNCVLNLERITFKTLANLVVLGKDILLVLFNGPLNHDFPIVIVSLGHLSVSLHVT